MGIEYFGGPRVLNGLTGETQTFAVGTSGTDFAIASSGSVHTFNIPDASATVRGLVTTGTQTFAGAKTFSSTVTTSGSVLTGGTTSNTPTATVPLIGLGGDGSNNGWLSVRGNDSTLFGRYGLFYHSTTDSTALFGYSGRTVTLGHMSAGGTYTPGWFFNANTVEQRNSTNAQTFRVYNTYTSGTSSEFGQLNWTSNEFRIGTAVGSAGGSQRSTVIGNWNTAGTWSSFVSVNVNGTATFTPNTAVTNAAWTAGDWSLQVGGTNRGLYTAGSGAAGRIIFYDQTGVLYGTGTGQNVYMQYDGWSGHSFAVTATAGSAPIPFRFTDAAYSALTASTEMTSVTFNLAQTKTFAAGALATQRAFRIRAPTYAFAGASTITTASTLSISGPPVAGTNATITNPYSLYVESGTTWFNGNVKFGNYTSFTNGPDTWTFEQNSSMLWGGRSMSPGSTDWLFNGVSSFCFRNGTSAVAAKIFGTYASTTSYERLNLRGVASANFEIGPENGSAGGTLRGLTIGGYSAGSSTITPWLTFTNAGVSTFSGQVIETPPASVTLATNGQFSIEMTSNTTGNLVYRGSDGTTRRCALTFV